MIPKLPNTKVTKHKSYQTQKLPHLRLCIVYVFGMVQGMCSSATAQKKLPKLPKLLFHYLREIITIYGKISRGKIPAVIIPDIKYQPSNEINNDINNDIKYFSEN